jgi:hypothetical protein
MSSYWNRMNMNAKLLFPKEVNLRSPSQGVSFDGVAVIIP